MDLAKKVKTARTIPGQRVVNSITYTRDPSVAEYTRRKAKCSCDLCGIKAPFEKRDGTPYLEIHHIVWLSRGGEDTISNTVALCPNCHRKMHILNLKDDIVMLQLKKKYGKR